MTWFKVDDNLAFHHKVVAAGNAAMGLWVRAGAMCAQQLTDGFVPDHMVAALDGKAQAKRLVAVNLWTREDGGYRFHEWSERQPSATDVKAASEKQGRSGSLGNHRRWHLAKGVRNPDCEHCQAAKPLKSESGKTRKPNRVPDTPPESVPNRPSRPVPTRVVSDGSDEPTATAQPLIGEWLERCTERPPGRVVGQVAREVKAMLDEGIGADRVRVGLLAWQRKGLHPSTLASVVHEATAAAATAASAPPSGDTASWMRKRPGDTEAGAW